MTHTPVRPIETGTPETAAALPVNVSSPVEGDPAAGEALFHTFQPVAGISCAGCHRTETDDRLIGPGLRTVGIRAQTRVPGQSALQYIYTSIVDPSAYVVEGYPDLMPKNWGRAFTDEQVRDIAAYLLSLSDG
jgi:mono/diheme cytochrome c family protein